MAAEDGRDRKFGVLLAVVVAVVSATSSPWWWDRLWGGSTDEFVGGCEEFTLHAQNQYDPLGAKIWSEPIPTADSARGFSPNELITVDGWVRTTNPYPSNPPPLDRDAWFHIANSAGWVNYAAVRSTPTDPTAGNFADVVSPAPLDPDCQGTWRQ